MDRSILGNVAGGSAPPTDTSPPPPDTSPPPPGTFVKTRKTDLVGKLLTGSDKVHLDEFLKNYIEKHGDFMPSPAPGNIPQGSSYCTNENQIAKIQRKERKYRANRFRSQYAFGITAAGCSNPFAGTIEDRTCIWPNNSCSWMERSSGIMWVGVHGLDSICVVNMSGHLDWNRVRGGLVCTCVRTVLNLFKNCVISEIEDLADPYSELCQKHSWSIEKPFGVVSVCSVTTEIHKESGHEASSVEYDGKKAIEFLQDKMTSETSFTLTETIQTAISAFQLLFQKKFEAKEIEVSVVDPNYFISIHERNKDPCVEEFETWKIEKYLAAINKHGSVETEEHAAAVIDNPCPPVKKQKTSMVPETQVPAPGGSTITSETTD